MKTENINIPPLKLDGKLHATDPAKATALNSQFKSEFNVEDSSNIPNKGSSPYPDINHLEIGLEGVAKQFNNIIPNKASGPDELPARHLKTVSSEIAPLMQFLFQQSYNQGCVPEDWNIAIVTAIHKQGPKWDPGNYRLISLTCLVCKVMEHVVLSHMAKHLAAYIFCLTLNTVFGKNCLLKRNSSLLYMTGRQLLTIVGSVIWSYWISLRPLIWCHTVDSLPSWITMASVAQL